MPTLRLSIVAACALSARIVAAQGDSVARVDSVFARWNTRTTPGCAVGVARDGKTIVSRAYGMANLEYDVPLTPASIIEAGSVSKQFTATAIILLAQEGKLSLDDDARKYVPELPKYGKTITVRHLLNHTSGLRDWGSVVSLANWPRGARVHTHAHVLDVVSRQTALNYQVGAEYSYTNTGYNLAAIIVDRVSGMPFAEFTRKRIFEPLGMTSTQWRDDYTRVVKGRAASYMLDSGVYHTIMPFENVHGNGGLLTTVGDLLRWNEHLANRTVVGGAATVSELERRGILSNGRTITYAQGLVVTQYKGVPEISHGGATAGYRAYLARYPEQKLSVALLCNVGNANPDAYAHRVADIFLEGQVKSVSLRSVASVSLPASELEARAGLFRSTRTGEALRLRAENGKLRIENGPELMPVSPTHFESVSGWTAHFEVDASGRIRVVRQISPDNDTVSYVPAALAKLGREALAAYTGTYRSDEAEATYVVALGKDGELRLRARPDIDLPLTTAYVDAFTNPRVGLVRFSRDASGKVTGLRIGAGRVRDMPFVRVAAAR